MCWVEFKFAVIMDKKVVSRYCYLFKTSKSVCLAYSSKTNSFIELSEDLFDILNKSITKGNYVVPHDLPDNILKILEHEGIVCGEQDDDDYVTRCQFITQSVQHDKSKLNLVLVPTLNCNFNCPYCFENGKKVSRMDDNTINNLIAFIRDSEYAKELTLTWYGGEPLLAGYEFYEHALNQLSTQLSHLYPAYAIQTNLWLMDDKLAQLFKKYEIPVGSSLDGPKELNDRQRGIGYYDKTLKGYEIAKKYGLRVSFISTFTNYSIKHKEEIFEFFKENGLNLKIHPALPSLKDDNGDEFALEPKDYGELMLYLLDQYLDLADTIELKNIDRQTFSHPWKHQRRCPPS